MREVVWRVEKSKDLMLVIWLKVWVLICSNCSFEFLKIHTSYDPTSWVGCFKLLLKVIRHVSGFGIEFLENKDTGIFGHFMVIDFIDRFISYTYFHLFKLPDIVDLELGVLSVMANDAYKFLWISPCSGDCFLWNFVFQSRKAYIAHQYRKMMYNLYIDLP